jgi:hypothetical protein
MSAYEPLPIGKYLSSQQIDWLLQLDHSCSARYRLEKWIDKDGTNVVSVSRFLLDNRQEYHLPLTIQTLHGVNLAIAARVSLLHNQGYITEANEVLAYWEERAKSTKKEQSD